tara:strand:- start:1228 stop:1554 length:327 start_codon:yes stop_codon:yes gene_type:complete
MSKSLQLKKDGIREVPISESSSRKGDFAEYYAITWLWDNGYEVFPNAGGSGPVDMVAIKDGEVTLVDVKTLGLNTRSHKTRTQEQKNMGVVFLGFEPDTRKLRWINHR